MVRTLQPISLFDLPDEPTLILVEEIDPDPDPDPDFEDLDPETDPEVVLEQFFETGPTVAELRFHLEAFPANAPVYINGEGRVWGIELIDPTHSAPFRHIVPEIHVVIG